MTDYNIISLNAAPADWWAEFVDDGVFWYTPVAAWALCEEEGKGMKSRVILPVLASECGLEPTSANCSLFYLPDVKFRRANEEYSFAWYKVEDEK